MAKAGKILALLGGILVLIGTFALSLFQPAPGVHVYGIQGILNIATIWTGGVWGIVAAVGYCLYLLAFLMILIGIKIRVLAFIGALFPIAAATFVFLGGVWAVPLGYLATFQGGAAIWTYIPLSFPSLLFMGSIDLGTWVVGVGGLLALVSAFLSRDDY